MGIIKDVVDNKVYAISDITFQGSNEEFVWKSPITDFANGSKLTVHESQEALFYFNGACAGVLGPGSHILETEYIPFLQRLLQKVLGVHSIFHAEIYFVNRVVLDFKWGVGDIVYEDPAGPVFNIGCHGQINLQSEDSRRIVEKLVGADHALTKTAVEDKFRMLLAARIQDSLVNTMVNEEISVTRVSANLRRISSGLEPDVSDLFGQYGFSLENFAIVGVHMPEDNPEYQRLKALKANQGLQMSELQLEQQRAMMQAQIAAQKTMVQADAEAYKRKVQGYDYATEKQFEFLNNIATNQNAGAGISSDMLQMGAGLGMIGTVGNMMQNMTSPFANTMGNMTSMPGGYGYGQPMAGYGQQPAGMPGDPAQAAANLADPATQAQAQPAEAAPAAAPAPAEDPVEVLTRLKRLLDAGLIEQAEYDAKKNEILARM